MTLSSPGVEVSVIDESFYAPAGAGTVPLIIIATAQDKTAPDGSGTAAYTTAAQADELKLITSQRELLQNYGNPSFKSSGGTQLHGSELNEYGLLAAYSFLGLANRAYVLRADIDLSALESSATATTSAPANGSYWLDTANTIQGLKRWNATTSAWELQTVTVVESSNLKAGNIPKDSYGKLGDYAVVYEDTAGTTLSVYTIYEKTTTSLWEVVGSAGWQSTTSNELQIGDHTELPALRELGGALQEGDLYYQTNSLSNGTNPSLKVYDTTSEQFLLASVLVDKTSKDAYDFYTSPAEGDIWFDVAATTVNVTPKRHNGASTVVAASSSALTDTEISNVGHTGGAVAFTIAVNTGTAVDVVFTTDSDADGNLSVDDMVLDINSALSGANAEVSYTDTVTASNVSGVITITDTDGKDISLQDGNVSNFGVANLNLSTSVYSNWEDLSYTAQSTDLVGTTAEGTLWYDATISNTNIDILEHNGSTWVTYTGDVNVSATEPTTQSDGSSSLAAGDLWIDSSDLENYPLIYKYSGTAWVLVDNTDQLTPDGVVFADFRQSSASSLDSDAPQATLYPNGIIGWNKRASGGNVKSWDATNLWWTDASGNRPDGAPYMLRKAQRAVIVAAMQSVVTSNEDIRNEINRFNLLVAPGYPELADEMIALATDRKETVFSIIDPPLRLAADATSTANWVTNAANAPFNGEDGLLASSEYAAVYYPSGLTTNLDGSNVMVPASHMALRTIAYSDQVSYVWFPPAGDNRGQVDNATSVGYLNATSGEYVPVSLSEGQRDALYLNNINPIANFPIGGIKVYGQKTLTGTSSALDRINVARLVVYIREQLDDIVRPFIFEVNDEVTRSNAKVVVDRFLGEIAAQRGLFDFVVVCDSTNNTPARIDRNELHIDVAIQPAKAVEFIYIPLRVQNTLGQTN